MSAPAPLTPLASSEEAAPPAPTTLTRGVWVRVTLIVVAAVSSVVITKLALFAAVATLLGFVSLPAAPLRPVRFMKVALAIGAVCATFGTFRFLVLEAVPGMVDGGTTGALQGNLDQLWAQFEGVGIVIVFNTVVSVILFKLVDLTIGLRVTVEEEVEGLDISLHGETIH